MDELENAVNDITHNARQGGEGSRSDAAWTEKSRLGELGEMTMDQEVLKGLITVIYMDKKRPHSARVYLLRIFNNNVL